MRHGIVYSLDIETVSQGKRANDYTDVVAKQRVKLGNTKDPLKIEAKRKEAAEEARNKHGLSWWTGKIVSVGIIDTRNPDRRQCFHGHDEKKILEALATDLNVCDVIGIVGKNSSTFDVAFLIGRFMANSIPVPNILKDRYKCEDMDTYFGYKSGMNQHGKLDDYAHGLGIAGKTEGCEGSQVQKMYNEILFHESRGESEEANAIWKKLCEYNMHDCEVVAEAWRRYHGEA